MLGPVLTDCGAGVLLFVLLLVFLSLLLTPGRRSDMVEVVLTETRHKKQNAQGWEDRAAEQAG